MTVWSEDVGIEIEALQATYGDDLTLDEPLQQISMTVLPQQDTSKQQHYVQCQLLLTLPPEYPSKQPPGIQLQDVKGFANRQQQMQEQLAADAVELTGELLLGHLFEAAKAWLTEQDWPEGPCIFCLDDLAAAAGSNTPTVRLPCFHAYHECCFADWWCWQQQAYCEQQKALEEKTGATAAATLVQEKLPPKDGPHFQLSCPSCRAPFQLQDLPQLMQQQLQVQRSQQQQQQQAQAVQQQQHPAAAKLTAAQLQPFLELQQRHAQLFAKQQQRQGIIDTDVSYSITNWEGGSTASGSSGTAVPPSPGSTAPSSTIGGTRAGRGAGPNRDGLPGRGNGSSSSSGGGNSVNSSSRGRGRGRGRGHHQRLSDGSGGWSDSMQEQAHQIGSQQQQQQRTQHGPHARRQQGWEEEEQEWAPKPGRHHHSRGRGQGRQQQQQQQQQQPRPVQQHGVSVQTPAAKQQQAQQQQQQQSSPRQEQQAAPPQQSALPRPEQALASGRQEPHAGRSRGRSRGAGRARGAGRGDGGADSL